MFIYMLLWFKMFIGLCKRNGVIFWLFVSSLNSESRTVACFNLSMFLNKTFKEKVPRVSKNYWKTWIFEVLMRLFFLKLSRSTLRGLRSGGKGGCTNLITDFDENYGLLCAIMDAVTNSGVCNQWRPLSDTCLLFFFLFYFHLMQIFPFRVKLHGCGLRYMEFFPLWKIQAKVTPAEFCSEC